MDRTVLPLRAMLDAMDEVFPAGNVHIFVDEAHVTGLHGWPRDGRGARAGGSRPGAVAYVWQGPHGVRWYVCTGYARECTF
jgi:hypothetical protein